MFGLIFIVPIVAFDVWLFCTTARRQARRWIDTKDRRKIAIVAASGLILAVALPVFVRYSNGTKMRVQGFPIPLVFFFLGDNGQWTRTESPGFLPCAALVTDILTGLAAPFIPGKIAEFLKTVKAELK